jgi:hypothetical protein
MAEGNITRCFRRPSRELEILQSHLLAAEGLEFLDPTFQFLDA